MTETGPGGELRNTVYKTVTRSGRRMTRARRVLYAVLVPLGMTLIRLWWLSCRVTRVVGEENLTAALAKAPSLVPCYWHQHQLFCARYLLQQRARGLMPGWLISPSVDGELGAMMVTRIGARAIRGSSSHTGARALRGLLPGPGQGECLPDRHPGRAQGAAFQVQTRGHTPGADVRPPHAAHGLSASRAWFIQWTSSSSRCHFAN